MELNDLTPFSPFVFESLDEDDRPIHVIICRGTFELLEDGQVNLSSQQAPVLLADEYRDAPLTSSILNDTDLVPKKRRADVSLNATAMAPDGRPCDAWNASIQVGKLNTSLRVTGQRWWKHSLVRGWHLTEPLATKAVPVHYEFAFGGVFATSDQRVQFEENPVGKGFVVAKDVANNEIIEAPQVESPLDPVSRFGKIYKPVGWGPIAKHWLPRRLLCGNADDQWKSERWPKRPKEFDFNYYSSAPTELMYPGFLAGGEEVVIRGCSIRGEIRFAIPCISVAGVAIENNLNIVPLQLQLDTLFIDLVSNRVSLTWRNSFLKTNELAMINLAAYSSALEDQ